MGMAQAQDIPEKKAPREPWTVRRLLGGGVVPSTIAKTFINVFDVLLGFSLLVIGIAELLGRHVSWIFYVITLLLFFAAFFERRANSLTAPSVEKDKKKDE